MTTQQDKTARILKDDKSLRTLPSSELKAIVSRNRRVVDLRGVGKASLITMILQDQWGVKAVSAAFNPAK